MLWQPLKEEVKNKEFATQDIDMGFDKLHWESIKARSAWKIFWLSIFVLIIVWNLSHCMNNVCWYLFRVCISVLFHWGPNAAIPLFSLVLSIFEATSLIFIAWIWCELNAELQNSCISSAESHLRTTLISLLETEFFSLIHPFFLLPCLAIWTMKIVSWKPLLAWSPLYFTNMQTLQNS